MLGKYKCWEGDYQLRTSRFCYRDYPIAHHGCRISSLRGGSEYTNFKIRCCNLKGWSEWVDMIVVDDNNRNHGSSNSSSNGGALEGVYALEMTVDTTSSPSAVKANNNNSVVDPALLIVDKETGKWVPLHSVSVMVSLSVI